MPVCLSSTLPPDELRRPFLPSQRFRHADLSNVIKHTLGEIEASEPRRSGASVRLWAKGELILMRTPLAFLCFDIEHDEQARAAFMSQVAGSTSVSVDHWSTKPESPRADWDKLVQTNISRCDIMIVLVGASTKSSEAVQREIGYAKRSNVPFFGIYAEGSEAGAPLPEGLSANRIATWDWKQIDSAVKQLMAEGKHYSISNHS